MNEPQKQKVEKGETKDPLAGLRLSAGTKLSVKELNPAPESSPGPNLIPDPSVGGKAVELDLAEVGNGPWYQDLDEEVIQAMTTPSGAVALPMSNRNFNANLRRPEDLSVVDRGSESITVGWTAPRDSELSRFEVEILGVMTSPELGQPVAVWQPYETVEFERIGRLVKAEIEGLAPKAKYEFRVLMIDETGRSSHPSDVLMAETELPMDWTYIYLVLGVAVVIALGMSVAQVIRDRRADVYQAKYVDD
jgi:hypothetical protein